MKSSKWLLALIVAAVSSCATDGSGALIDVRTPNADGYAPLFKHLFILADELLQQNGQELRPFCLEVGSADQGVGTWTHHDPPETVLSELSSEREVYAWSQCSQNGLRAPDGSRAAHLWVKAMDDDQPDTVTLGFGVNTLWIRAYECEVETAGEELFLGGCTLLYVG